MGILHNRCILFVLGIDHKTPFNTSKGAYLLRLISSRWRLTAIPWGGEGYHQGKHDLPWSINNRANARYLPRNHEEKINKNPPEIPLYAGIDRWTFQDPLFSLESVYPEELTWFRCRSGPPAGRCNPKLGTAWSACNASGSQSNILWNHCSSFPRKRGICNQIAMKQNHATLVLQGAVKGYQDSMFS